VEDVHVEEEEGDVGGYRETEERSVSVCAFSAPGFPSSSELNTGSHYGDTKVAHYFILI